LKKPNIQSLVNLNRFTTLRVGGTAEWFAEPISINEVKELINWSQKNNSFCNIIGAGSNLLVTDNVLKGVTLCMKKLQGCHIDKSSGTIEALAGEPIPVLARRAAKAGLHGLEWSIGIPGTVGGAAVINAGAQGNSIEDKIDSVTVISLKGGEPFKLTKEELKFAYRQSILQQEKLVVLSARFNLEPGHNPKELIHITNKNLNHRLNTQPYHQPSCGSIFRNPEPLKAGRIIENLGLKGFQIGGAEISRVHANFIINSNNATASDIAEIILLIQKKVKSAHGFVLHPEVKRLGFGEIL